MTQYMYSRGVFKAHRNEGATQNGIEKRGDSNAYYETFCVIYRLPFLADPFAFGAGFFFFGRSESSESESSSPRIPLFLPRFWSAERKEEGVVMDQHSE
jgi:hypothetical protein